VSISAYSRSAEQPSTARQIIALGVALAVVVVGLIAFSLTLERLSLLDDLKKDVLSLALVHRNYADRELRQYDGLLRTMVDRVRHGYRPDDLIRQRQSYDPALVEGRVLGLCVVAPGTGCPSAIARTPGGPIPNLLMDTLPGTVAGKRILIARQLDPILDLTEVESREEAGGRMIALTLDLDEMARGLQGVAGVLDARVTLALHTANDDAATNSSFGDGHVASTLRISSLPLSVTVTIPVDGELELWQHHVAAGIALAAILIAGIAGVVRLLLWQSAKRHEAIVRLYEAGRALSEQVSLQQALIDAIPLPLSMRDGRGVFFRCNRAFLDLTLRRQDEVLGRTSAQVFGQETAMTFDQGIAEALARSTPIRFEMSLTDSAGAIRDVTIYRSAHRHADGVGATIISVTVDDTERKRNDSALKESEERFHLAVRGSNDGIWDWDLRTGRIWFSARWKEMLGYRDDELDNTLDMWASVIFEEDRIAALKLVEDYTQGRVPSFLATQRFHHKQGHTCYILARAIHQKDEDGTPIRLVGAHTDITR
jgi:PAS domain S-box-containing protein